MLACLTFLAISWLTMSSVWEALAVSLSLYVSLTFVARMEQFVALLDCLVFIAALEILLVPAITYWLAPATMPIESAPYFGYALPAWIAFYAGISSSSVNAVVSKQAIVIQAIKEHLRQRPQASLALWIVGFTGFIIKSVLPMAPAFVSTLPMYGLLVGVLYAGYATHPYRMLMGGLTLLVLVVHTLRTGMFSDFFFWVVLWLIFAMAKQAKPITNKRKLVGIGLALAVLLLIQSIKAEYRYHTWGYLPHERTANAQLMVSLIADRLTQPHKLFSLVHFSTAFVRFNQGIMIGSAMAKVPLHEPYAQGEILLAFLYPFVPRFVWPNKPQTGGHENIRRFTSLPQFDNTSINLSPIGEGYVNFGHGGILFAFVYGLLLGGCFRLVVRMATQIPSLMLWLPMLFIGGLTMETDILSTWGSLVNNALFIIVLYRLLALMGIQL